MEQKTNKKKASAAHKLATIIGVVIYVILMPVLIINVSLIINSFVKPDEVPSLGGKFPLIVLRDSMYPDIKRSGVKFPPQKDYGVRFGCFATLWSM